MAQTIMKSELIRQKFLEFFRERGHVVVPSSSLIPDDPSVLLTTAGMQQFKKYYTGELDAKKDFLLPDGSSAIGTVSIQKSFRTSDIDEVGDESHLTFFEMLGNFSFGGYFKEEAIKYAHEFMTSPDWMNLKIDYVSVFGGGDGVAEDKDSEKIWKSIDPALEVKKFGMNDNFWGPTGAEGPCGPTTEVYVKNAQGKSIEIWNVVFNEYYKHLDGKFEKLKTPGIDTGMGLERLAMVSQDVSNIFETDLFKQFMDLLSRRGPEKPLDLRTQRIIADHTRGIVFLIADGVRPSNKDAGYILRRLIRRATTYVYLGIVAKDQEITLEDLLRKVISGYNNFYKELNDNAILNIFHEEQKKFLNTLDVGLRELNKIEHIDARSAFRLYESYGLPYEVIKDLGGEKVRMLTRETFDEEFKKHQEISRAGVEKKFGGHGLVLNTGELKAGSEEELQKVVRLHTATHLLQRALREVLGSEVSQRGSDITPERTRFDFSFPRKLTPEEIKKVEDLINQKIAEDLPVNFIELPKEEAEKTGALYFFREKYPEKVKVYYVGESLPSAWSREFCGGPHVKRTGEIGNFKIIKEEASSAGVRRIRGVVE